MTSGWIAAATPLQFTFENLLIEQTYYYRVRARDHALNEGAFSAPQSSKQVTPPPIAAPTGLHVLEANATQVTLKWNPSITPNINMYRLYRSQTQGGPYQLLLALPRTVTTDTAITAETFYYYVVTAIDSTGQESACSNEAVAFPKNIAPPTITYPAIPKKTNDTTPMVSGTTLAVVPPTPAMSVRLYANASLVATVTASTDGLWTVATAHYAAPLPDGNYALTARAVDQYGNTSPLSLSVSIAIDTAAPTAPTGLSALPMNNAVHLQWLPNTDSDLLGYNIYRKGPGETEFTKLNSLPVVGTQYRDTNVINGIQYRYRITAVDNTLNESD